MPFYAVTIRAGEVELLSARIEARSMAHAKAQALATLERQRGHAKKAARPTA